MKKIFYAGVKGFTLAEVLVTLAVIGIVASMTIPSLVKNYQEKTYITQFKKSYRILYQTYAKVLQENGHPNTWNVAYLDDIADYFIPHLQTIKTCKVDSEGFNDCRAKMGYPTGIQFKDLHNNSVNSLAPHLKLASGEIIKFSHQISVSNGLDCTALSGMCFMIEMDINGIKPPNRHGVDIHTFIAEKDKIRPRGSQYTHAGDTRCDPVNDTTTPGWWNGSSCGAWILLHENMDYLKCIDDGQAEYCHSY